MKKKHILLSIAILFSVFANAQIKLKGKISNTENKPLEMAYIIAKEKQSKRVAAYGSSNESGNYELGLKANTTYLVKVSYIGLRAITYELHTHENDMLKDFQLQEDNTLNDVDVVYKIPIKVDGDTITYNADSFTNGTEKKLEDVLKKLPGVELDDEGGVKVGGKKVKKLMVEGKDFFEGDTKLATKNIPADAVDKVQVLQNHSEIDQMSNLTDNSDNIALNIKLKEGKKNFWFGNITAGAAWEQGYLLNPKLFYYSPKYSINIIGDLNNIGQQSFTFMDYFKFTGGFKNMSKETEFDMSSDIQMFTMQNDKAKQIDAKFGAVNFTYSATKNWNLSGFAIYSGNNIDTETKSRKIYTNAATANTPIEDLQTYKSTADNLGLFKLGSTYKPNNNHQLDYDVLMKTSANDGDITRQSSVLQNINESSEAQILSLKQNMDYYYTLNDRHIFTAKIQHLLQNENPFYNAQLKKFSFSELLNLNTKQSIYNISQTKKLQTHKLGLRINYFYVINNKSNINLSIGNMHNQQSFNSSLFQVSDNGSENEKANNNNVQYAVNDAYTSLHYRFIKGMFVINSGVNFHLYSTANTQKDIKQTVNFHNFMPDVSVNIKLNSRSKIYIKYGMTTVFTDINKIAEDYVMSNYNQLFAGNRNLEHSLNHKFSINYLNFNSFNFSNLFVRFSYANKIKDIKQDVYFDGINMLNTSVNSNLPDESMNFTGNYSKSFVGVKWDLKANLNYSKSNNLHTLANNVKENNKSTFILQNYVTSFRTNFNSFVNFDIGYNVSINNYKSLHQSNDYISHKPFFNLNLVFFEQIIINADYIYNYYMGNNTHRKYSFLNANINYQKKDSKWEFIVSCNNLLNTQSLNTNSGNDFYTSNYQYIIRKPYYMFMIRYNL